MKKVLVTGASGFIGKKLIQALIEKNITIYAVNRSNTNEDLSNLKSTNLTFIKCNLSEIFMLETLIDERDFDVIYHFAWDGVSSEYRNDLFKQIKNIDYSLNVVKLSKKLGARRVVFLGSSMEYAFNNMPIDELSKPTPLNAYASTKLAVRFLCEQLAKDLSVQLIYCVTTSVYGVGREDNNIIYYAINELLKGKKPSFTSLAQKWDFIHIDDLTNILVLIGESTKSKEFYSIGAGENLQLLEYIEILKNTIDPKLLLGINEILVKDNRLPSSCINIQRITDDFQYKIKIPFSQGIKELIEYYRLKTK